MDDLEEQIDCAFCMDEDAVALTRKWNDSGGSTVEWTDSSGDHKKIMIFVDDDTCPALAHEVGHWAGRSHVTAYKRIMMLADIADSNGMGGSENRCRVIQSEADDYEDL